MLEMNIHRDVRATPARTFEVASDLRAAVGRIRAITKLEVLTPGPVRVGTRFRETRRMFGRDATEEMEILEFDPPRSFVMGCDNHGCRYRTRFLFTPSGAGTRMEMQFRAEGLTFFARLMGTLMKPLAKKMLVECGKDLDDIVAHAEGRTN